MKDDHQISEVDKLNFHLSMTSVFRFAKDRDPALRVRIGLRENILLKRCWG